jgi:hypothetical protein
MEFRFILKLTLLLITNLLIFKDAVISQSTLCTISTNFNDFYYFKNHENYWLASSGDGWRNIQSGISKDYLLNKSGLKGTFIQSDLYLGNDNILYSSTYEYLTTYDPQKGDFYSCQIDHKGHTYKENYKILLIDTLNHTITITADNDILIYNYKSQNVEEVISEKNQSVRFDFSSKRDVMIGVLWLYGSGIQKLKKEKNGKWKNEIFLEEIIFKNKRVKPIFNNVKIINEYAYLSCQLGIIAFHLNDNSIKWIYVNNNPSLRLNIQKSKYGLIKSEENQGLQIYNLSTKKWIPLIQYSSNQKIKSLGYDYSLYYENKNDIIITAKKNEMPVLYNLGHLVKLNHQIVSEEVNLVRTWNGKIITSNGNKISII